MPAKTRKLPKLPAKKGPSQKKKLEARWPEFFRWKLENFDVFALPMPPVESTNAGFSGHWRSRTAAKDAFFGQCETLLSHGLLPAPPVVPPVKVRLVVTMFVQKIHDRDNALARCKRVFDFLVRAGYMTNDDESHCEYGLPTQVLAGRTPPRVEISLEACE